VFGDVVLSGARLARRCAHCRFRGEGSGAYKCNEVLTCRFGRCRCRHVVERGRFRGWCLSIPYKGEAGHLGSRREASWRGNFESKGPVKANNTMWRASTAANKQRNLAMQKPSQSNGTSNRNNHASIPIHHRPIPPSRSPPDFHFEAHREGAASSWEMQRQRQRRCTKALFEDPVPW